MYICETIGGLAHLARALRWQRRGGRFESDILHIKNRISSVFWLLRFFIFSLNLS